MRRLIFCGLVFFLLSTSLPCFAQQTDIRQFGWLPAIPTSKPHR